MSGNDAEEAVSVVSFISLGHNDGIHLAKKV
jgi:hypothetical protein